MGSKVSNLEVLEMTSPQISSTTTSNFVTQSPTNKKISTLNQQQSSRITAKSSSNESPNKPRLNSIYYASIDNTSEMSSSDWTERRRSSSNDVDVMPSSESDDDDDDVAAEVFSAAPRKRSDSNCQNFVLIIDNLDSHLAEIDAQRSFKQHVNESSDVILNVLNISLQRESALYTPQKRYL